MTQDIPTGEWSGFLKRFSLQHRAWIATVHTVAAQGDVTRATPVRLKSASSLGDAVTFEFLDEQPPLYLCRPCAFRIQRTNAGAVQAVELETREGQFIRLAFRCSALPEQLDGLAPGEASLDRRSGESGRRRVNMSTIISLLTALLLLGGSMTANPPAGPASLLDTNLLVTWYGNPHSAAMGVLGQLTGAARAEALRRQAAAYIPLTRKRVLPAYHLVTIVAQPTPGRDKTFRRRESTDVIQAILDDARANGFVVVLDLQLGHAALNAELEHLRPFLTQPDVHLALDPEFDMGEGQVPGRQIGHTHADDVNTALDVLERVRAESRLPPKVLIVHQFTLAMLPDKPRIRPRAGIDLVLNMDGFGGQMLKLSSYRAVMRQHALPFAGMKLFYRQDVNLFTPAQVMGLTPVPSVVIYQ